MATFVLVHGANHGGWCWDRVIGPLRDLGHEVYAPSLTGLGDRAHLLNRTVNRETHIQDITNLLFYEDLHDVILVGHSYGGAVINPVGDRMPDRVAHLVHFNSIVPLDGESVKDVLWPDRRENLETLAARDGEGWLFPANRGIARLEIANENDIAWMEERLGPHPVECMRQQISLTGAYEAIPKSYILCNVKNARSASQVPPWERTPGWTLYTLDTGHDAMITDVPGTVQIFQQIANTLE